jgi:M6 family metalloprotease-like protein
MRPHSFRSQSRHRSTWLLRAVTLTVALVTIVSPLAAQAPGAPGLPDRVREFNSKVLEIMARLESAPGQGVRQEALTLLADRAQALHALMQSDPAAALSLAFSGELPGILARLLPEAAGHIESEGSWNGPVEYEVIDDETLTRAGTLARMKLGDEEIEIRFAGQDPDGLQCGDHLYARGIRLGQRVVAAEASIAGAATESGKVGARLAASGTRTASACSTLGTQRIAVLLVTFPGVNPPNITTAGVWNVLFGASGRTLNTYWRDASFGQTSATGDVFGWYTLDSLYTCDQTSAMRTAAIAAADADVDFRNYTRIFLLFPNPGGCSYAGRANVGCTSLSSPGDGSFVASTAWMLASYFSGENGAKLAGHEGGHNLGLMHSRSRRFSSEPLGALGTAGTISEYGDINANMGSWNWGHYPVQQKDKIGWLGSGGVATVQAPGSYSIVPLETPGGGLRGLKVQRGSGNNAWLWVEYRQPIGVFDSTLNSQIFTGATVHYVDSSTGSYTDLLDFTPGTSSFADPALAAGRTWVDPYTNVSLTIDAASPSALNVTVNYGPVPCIPANPSVTLSPSNPSAAPGATANYTLTVTNYDTAGCTAGTFSLSANVPAGWSATLAAPSLTISPGASVSTTLGVTPPDGTPTGSYPVGASASKGDYTGSASASLTVFLPCTTANPTVVLSPLSATVAPGGGAQFAVTVTNNDSAGCSATTYNLSSSKPGGWTATLGISSLTLAPGASGSTTLAIVTRSSASPSTYTVSASAAKGSSSGAGTASVIVAPETSCTAANPTVTLSPSSQSVVAGGSVTFTMTVTNNDSSSCSGGTFSLSAATPSGWTGTLSASSLNLAPGASGSATLTVTPPSGASASTYPVTATAAKGSYSGSGSASVTVTAPPPLLSAAVSVAGTSFTSRDAVPITANVLSGGSPVRASVIFTVTKPDGSQATKSATTGAEGSTTWSYRFGPKDPAGTYSVAVQATYGGQTAASPAAIFQLQ